VGVLGTVTTLRRYPVKSMLGEDMDAADVSVTGLAGDRRLAVISRSRRRRPDHAAGRQGHLEQ
jgi:uncharacterized protein YcbX